MSAGCECPARKALEPLRQKLAEFSMKHDGFLYGSILCQIDAALGSTPCPCEQREEQPTDAAWIAMLKYAYEDGKDGAQAIQQITSHYNFVLAERNRIRTECERLSNERNGLLRDQERLQEVANRFRNPSRTVGLGDILDPLAFLEMVLAGIHRTQAELAAARSLLEEARKALVKAAKLLRLDGWEQTPAVDAALAKINAARKREVNP